MHCLEPQIEDHLSGKHYNDRTSEHLKHQTQHKRPEMQNKMFSHSVASRTCECFTGVVQFHSVHTYNDITPLAHDSKKNVGIVYSNMKELKIITFQKRIILKPTNENIHRTLSVNSIYTTNQVAS
jgi:hypothetical protein